MTLPVATSKAANSVEVLELVIAAMAGQRDRSANNGHANAASAHAASATSEMRNASRETRKTSDASLWTAAGFGELDERFNRQLDTADAG